MRVQLVNSSALSAGLRTDKWSFSCALASLVWLLFGSFGCNSVWRCNAGFSEEVKLDQEWMYVSVFQVDIAGLQSLRTEPLDSSVSQAFDYQAKYRDFVFDTALTYWAVHICVTGRILPDVTISTDSVLLYCDELGGPIPIANLADRTYEYSLEKCYSIEPVPLPNRFEGRFRISLLLTIDSKSRGSLVKRKLVWLDAGCWRERKSLIPFSK